MSLSLIDRADKRTVRRIFFGGAAVSWCIFIFLLSAEDALESGMTSGGVIRFFCELLVPDFVTDTEAERAALIDSLQFWVRKAAHFTAYMILGALAAQVFMAIPRLKTAFRMCLCAWGFSVLYAVSDEIHQSFVPGRAMQARDVLIDSAGALLGVVISYLVSAAAEKRSSKRKEAQNEAGSPGIQV